MDVHKHGLNFYVWRDLVMNMVSFDKNLYLYHTSFFFLAKPEKVLLEHTCAGTCFIIFFSYLKLITTEGGLGTAPAEI